MSTAGRQVQGRDLVLVGWKGNELCVVQVGQVHTFLELCIQMLLHSLLQLRLSLLQLQQDNRLSIPAIWLPFASCQLDWLIINEGKIHKASIDRLVLHVSCLPPSCLAKIGKARMPSGFVQ